MTVLEILGAHKEIPLILIDPPALASRETFDERALLELADSIKLVGVIQAVGVKPIGHRFEVIYGHRRYIAAKLASLDTLPCRVYDDTTISPEALKVIENAEREEVNAGEEAIYFSALLDQLCGGDTDRLAALVGRSREYVEARLVLLRGDPDVLAALKTKRIGLIVARELNAIHRDTERRMYLDSAVRNGCTARLARDWRLRANALNELREATEPPPSGDAERAPQPPGSPLRCLICGEDDAPHDMGLYYIHNPCFRLLMKPFLRGLTSEPKPPIE